MIRISLVQINPMTTRNWNAAQTTLHATIPDDSSLSASYISLLHYLQQYQLSQHCHHHWSNALNKSIYRPYASPIRNLKCCTKQHCMQQYQMTHHCQHRLSIFQYRQHPLLIAANKAINQWRATIQHDLNKQEIICNSHIDIKHYISCISCNNIR